jgi:ribulose kinase
MLPTPQERLDHESQWGESYANRHMNIISETYRTNKDKLNRHPKKELLTKDEYNVNKYINRDQQQKMEVQISSIDYGLYTSLQELKEKYHGLIDRHNDLCNNIIETLYPKDLQIQIEIKIRNPKNKDKKYFEIKRGYITDALISTDSVHGHARGTK